MRGKSASVMRRRRIDVVIEAVFERRAEGELRAGEETHDGAGHDVGGAVAQDFQRLGVFRGEDGEGHFRVAGRQFAVEIDDGAVHLGGDGVLGQALADGFGHVARPGAGGDFAARAVGEFESRHGGESPWKGESDRPYNGRSTGRTRGPFLAFARGVGLSYDFAGGPGMAAHSAPLLLELPLVVALPELRRRPGLIPVDADGLEAVHVAENI